MKNKKLKRLAAVAAACTIMASAMPVVESVSYAAKNLISNSTFETGTSGWGTYKERNGACTLTTEDEQLAINITNVGKVNYSVQAFYDIIPLYKNGKYHIKYDISSTIDRRIEAMIQQNGGNYTSYTWKALDLTSEPQTIEYDFTMEYKTDIMAKLCFNCGFYEDYEGYLPKHTVYIDNVSVELIDDSEVDYDADKPYEPDIITNQVGYRPDAPKSVVVRKKGLDDSAPVEFKVVNDKTGAVAYKNLLGPAQKYAAADESEDRVGDFSELREPGDYHIEVEGCDKSYSFYIGENVYKGLTEESVKMLYLQRCGVEVEDKDFGHEACHKSLATVYGTTNKIDVSGGWHDAGDYGRYVVPGAKTIADLLYAYQAAPTLFGDSTGIPESGNKVPDILDEARFELEWMFKMQDANGGVHHKVSCATFPGYIAPQKEIGELIVTPISSTATADFCASMAMAAEFYEKFDKEFAEKCLAAAEKAWAYLEENPDFDFTNPKDIVTGDYGDKTDKDERYWAAAQLFRTTGDEKYYNALKDMKTKTGLDWSTVGDYGNIALLTMDGIDKTSDVYKNAYDAVVSQADEFVETYKSNPYGVAISEFNWGSNMTIANFGNISALAYQLTGKQTYLDAANAQLDYLLGENANGVCFVSGWGTVSPQHPHHRPSMVAGKAMPCMLAGGVNQNLEDSAAKAYCANSPAAKCYIDNAESYSTNEITIYWNSPLTYLLALTNTESVEEPTSTEPSSQTESYVWGDANVDGQVNIADAVLVMQVVTNPDKYDVGKTEISITENGKKYADVDGTKGLTNSDALAIQKFKLGLVNKLPLPDASEDLTSGVIIIDGYEVQL